MAGSKGFQALTKTTFLYGHIPQPLYAGNDGVGIFWLGKRCPLPARVISECKLGSGMGGLFLAAPCRRPYAERLTDIFT